MGGMQGKHFKKKKNYISKSFLFHLESAKRGTILVHGIFTKRRPKRNKINMYKRNTKTNEV